MAESELQVRMLSYDELDPAIIASWESLEERALEPNAYLSPCFVLPALRQLCGEAEVKNARFAFVARPKPFGSDLIGAGVFVHSPGGRRFPLPHLRSFLSLHSYLSGFLLDRQHSEAAVRALFGFFRRNGGPWHGVDLVCLPADGVQAELVFRAARESGSHWYEITRSNRAVFIPSEGGVEQLPVHLSSHRLKRLRQAWRRLEARGHVEWHARFGHDVTDTNVERFLELEHMGWKRGNKTSLRSRPSEEAFFREMVAGFRKRGRVFFTELLLGGSVIASTSNLISGTGGFAYKIAWHPDYANASPGVLNELEFIRRAPSLCGGLSCIDSGAEEGSFIDQLWERRRTLVSGVFGITGWGRTALFSFDRLRKVRDWYRSLRMGRKE